MLERLADAAYWMCLLVGAFLAAMAGYAESVSLHPHLDKAIIFGGIALLLGWIAGRLIRFVMVGR